MSEGTYQKLRDINVSEWAEKKGKFNYLSWAHAVDQLGKAHPTATWEVHTNADGLPWFRDGDEGYVHVSVTVDSITKGQWHPILDNRNAPIKNPNAFQVNTSIQRCLAKAIGLHGLGIGLYCGEDLLQYDGEGGGQKSQPGGAQATQTPEQQARALMKHHGLTNVNIVAYMEMYSKGKVQQISDFGEKTWVWLADTKNMDVAVAWVNEQIPF